MEQRSNVGGLWNYLSLPKNPAARTPVPQPDPKYTEDAVISPVYDLLETNIPRGLMGFSDLPWDNKCQLFPEHETVLRYLEKYAKDVKHLIRFDTTVTNVSLTGDERWEVHSRSRRAGEEVEVFDAVLVASGHFDVPYVPDVRGMKAWNAAYPGSIVHSKYYRRPADFSEKKVVVIGSSASGASTLLRPFSCFFPLTVLVHR